MAVEQRDDAGYGVTAAAVNAPGEGFHPPEGEGRRFPAVRGELQLRCAEVGDGHDTIQYNTADTQADDLQTCDLVAPTVSRQRPAGAGRRVRRGYQLLEQVQLNAHYFASLQSQQVSAQ